MIEAAIKGRRFYKLTLTTLDPDDESKLIAYYPKLPIEAVFIDPELTQPLEPKLLNDLHLTEEERIRMNKTNQAGGYVLLDHIGKVPSSLFEDHCLFLKFEFRNVRDMLDNNDYQYPKDYGHLVMVHNMSDDEEDLGGSEKWAIYRFIGPDPRNRSCWQMILRDKNMDRVGEWEDIAGKPNASPAMYDEIVRLAHEHRNKDALDKFSDVEGKLHYDGMEILDKETVNTMYATKNLDSGSKGDVMIYIESSRIPEPVEGDELIELEEISDERFINSTYTVAPFLDGEDVVTANRMFANSLRLVSVPKYVFPNLTEAEGIFMNCMSLEYLSVPRWEYVRTLRSAFEHCVKLKSIAGMTINSCEDLSYFCANASSLQSVGEIQSANLLEAVCAFKECSSLEHIPVIDMSKLTTAESMYEKCTNMVAGHFNAPMVTNVNRAFYGCTKLESITLNIPSAMNVIDMFMDCPNLETVTIPNGGITSTISFAHTKLSVESLIDIISKLPSRGGESIIVTGTPAAAIGDTEIAKATAKGWTIVR
jgi:hypothetical protein